MLYLRFLIARLAGLAGVLAVLVVATFLMVRLVPGDPARVVAGTHATRSVLEVVRGRLGLDHALPVQFWNYVDGVVHFNLGQSFVTGEPVSMVIRERFASTFQLAAASFVLVMLVSVAAGIWAAALTQGGRHPKFEVAFGFATGLCANVPGYVMGTVLALVFGLWFKWLPVAGTGSLSALVLPTVALSLLPAAALSRIVRVEALTVLSQDYMRAAVAKGLSAPRRHLVHVLPNALTGALTIGGIYFAQLIGGAVVIETVFARAGLGTELVQSVESHDYPVVQGITLLLGVAIVTINVVVDLLLALVDPRSRQAVVSV